MSNLEPEGDYNEFLDIHRGTPDSPASQRSSRTTSSRTDDIDEAIEDDPTVDSSRAYRRVSSSFSEKFDKRRSTAVMNSLDFDGMATISEGLDDDPTSPTTTTILNHSFSIHPTSVTQRGGQDVKAEVRPEFAPKTDLHGETLSYRRHMWSKYPQVALKAKQDAELLKLMNGFFVARSKAAAAYAKELHKIARSYGEKTATIWKGAEHVDESQMHSVWERLIDFTEYSGQSFDGLSTALEKEYAAPIAHLLTRFETSRKKAEKTANELIKVEANEISALQKAQAAYLSACEDLVQADTALEAKEKEPVPTAEKLADKQEKEVIKLRKKANETRGKKEGLTYKYVGALESVNSFRKLMYEHELPAVLLQLEQLELIRARNVKRTLASVVMMEEDVVSLIAEELTALKTNVDNINEREQLEDIVLRYQCSTATPDEYSFQPHAIDVPIPDNPIFAVPLPQLMSRQATTHPDLPVPFILPALFREVEAAEGLVRRGLFRVSGRVDEVEEIRKNFDFGVFTFESSLTKYSAEAIAGSIKLFLRELPEPLVPRTLYNEAIKGCSSPEACVRLCRSLPDLDQAVIKYLLNRLVDYSVPSIADVTMMPLRNLAMVFAPAFFRDECTNPLEAASKINKEQDFIVSLVMGNFGGLIGNYDIVINGGAPARLTATLDASGSPTALMPIKGPEETPRPSGRSDGGGEESNSASSGGGGGRSGSGGSGGGADGDAGGSGEGGSGGNGGGGGGGAGVEPQRANFGRQGSMVLSKEGGHRVRLVNMEEQPRFLKRDSANVPE